MPADGPDAGHAAVDADDDLQANYALEASQFRERRMNR
jgi:hypothetical protein